MFGINASKKYLALPLLALSLTSCAIFQGQESTGQYVDDATITTKVKSAFVNDAQVKATQISVETMQGVVQLSGFVNSPRAEARAVELANRVNGVKSVQDDIIVRAPSHK